MRDHRSDNMPPSEWVVRYLPGVPAGGTVLDVACGGGRHLGLAREGGYRAVGVDRAPSLTGLALTGPVTTHPWLELIEADLEAGGMPPFAGRRFQGVVVTNYLWRPLLPFIVDAVADNGVLIYETFAVGNAVFGRPKNPDFLLRPGELIEAVRGRLVVMAFEHARLRGPDRIVQRICAAGPSHEWAQGTTAPPG